MLSETQNLLTAFIRFGVVVQLLKNFVLPFLSPYAHSGLKYVHLNHIFILPTRQNQDKGGNTFFGGTWWWQQAMIGGRTIHLRKAE